MVPSRVGSYFRPMPIQRLIVVADAHLGAVPASVEEALLHLLDELPKLGDGLLLNGDLFAFWFSYRRAIPRSGVRVLARLAALARRFPVLMTGGNRDRWGESFWEGELGIRFSAEELEFPLGHGRVIARHGDGIAEPTRRLALRHWIVGHPLTSAGYRALPPDLGFWLGARMGGRVDQSARAERLRDQAASLQHRWAERRLQDAAPGTLLVLGHTHRPVSEELLPRRRYLNPGAWLDGHRYAIATDASVTLMQYPG
jgi:UDP-2,3-diacylglucosamine hydrolase